MGSSCKGTTQHKAKNLEIYPMAKKSFSIEVRPDRIIVTTLHSFGRTSVEEWMAYVKAHDGKLVPPVRMLYDLRPAGPPSQYALEKIGPFMATLDIPEGTRNAYLFKSPFGRFADVIMRRMPPKAGRIRSFDDYDEAIEWLLAEKIDD
jgi:hypothetical protein